MKKKIITPRCLAVLLICLLLGPAAGSRGADPDPCQEKVDTTEGPVRGAKASKTDVCVYKGIPYAEPPVKDLRWRPPQPPARRGSTFEALEFGPVCAQKGSEMPLGLSGRREDYSEDCLRLNIWRPARESTAAAGFPVMVWIHGGALQNGSGSRSLYWGDRLTAQQDVILVTFNYRLGPLGFLYLPELSQEDEHGSAGNYGLLDQIAALQWVRDNAKAFGGDPDNVTIFGESAGGWSVCDLLASPPAKGLFQRAIIQSGACDVVHPAQEGERNGRAFADKLKCTGRDLLECLRAKTTRELFKAVDDQTGFTPLRDRAFIPHLDGYVLTAVPEQVLRDGPVSNVPLMAGSTRDEFKLMALDYPGIRYLPDPVLKWMATRTLGDDAPNALRHHYSLLHYRRPADRLIDAYGDVMLGCPTYEAVLAMNGHQDHLFYYRFDYDDHLYPQLIGAAHGTEIPFIFDTLDRPPFSFLYAFWQRKRARPLVEIMMAYWTNFARTGDPNGPGLPEWRPYDKDRKERLFLTDRPYSIHTDNFERCRYWRQQKIERNQPPGTAPDDQ